MGRSRSRSPTPAARRTRRPVDDEPGFFPRTRSGSRGSRGSRRTSKSFYAMRSRASASDVSTRDRNPGLDDLEKLPSPIDLKNIDEKSTHCSVWTCAKALYRRYHRIPLCQECHSLARTHDYLGPNMKEAQTVFDAETLQRGSSQRV